MRECFTVRSNPQENQVCISYSTYCLSLISSAVKMSVVNLRLNLPSVSLSEATNKVLFSKAHTVFWLWLPILRKIKKTYQTSDRPWRRHLCFLFFRSTVIFYTSIFLPPHVAWGFLFPELILVSTCYPEVLSASSSTLAGRHMWQPQSWRSVEGYWNEKQNKTKELWKLKVFLSGSSKQTLGCPKMNGQRNCRDIYKQCTVASYQITMACWCVKWF